MANLNEEFWEYISAEDKNAIEQRIRLYNRQIDGIIVQRNGCSVALPSRSKAFNTYGVYKRATTTQPIIYKRNAGLKARRVANRPNKTKKHISLDYIKQHIDLRPIFERANALPEITQDAICGIVSTVVSNQLALVICPEASLLLGCLIYMLTRYIFNLLKN